MSDHLVDVQIDIYAGQEDRYEFARLPDDVIESTLDKHYQVSRRKILTALYGFRKEQGLTIPQHWEVEYGADANRIAEGTGEAGPSSGEAVAGD